MKRMKDAMKPVNQKDYSKVEQRIYDTRNQLQEIQEQLRDCSDDQALFTQERELKKALEKRIMVEESILRQKYRIQWLKLGDTNFAFFHASIKNKIARNHIIRLVSSQGLVIQSMEGIENETISFYKSLLA